MLITQSLCAAVGGLAIGIGAAAFAAASEIPEALLRAREARERLHTAHLELSLYEASELHPGSSVVRFETWRAAGDQMLVMSNGDADGVTLRGPGNQPLPLNQAPRTLLRDGQAWHHLSNSNYVHVMDGARAGSFRLNDWRKIGLNPTTLQEDFDRQMAKFGNPEIRYQSNSDGDLELVRADGTGGTLEWWIDPQRDWNVVKTKVTLADGVHGGETRFELAYNPHDGIWFPARIEQYSFQSSEPMAVYEIIAARFNRPEHPAELTPADIGVGVGMTVFFSNEDGVHFGIWDGEQAIDDDEFLQKVASGELEVDPSVARSSAMGQAYAARAIERGERPINNVRLDPIDHARSAREGAWRRYTREFIERYALDDEQTQKAWSICEECLERADAYIDSRRDEFAELEKTALDKPAAAPRDRAGPSGDDAAIERRRAELLRPIDEIFERALKPRLEVLPTRQQRAKAEANE